MWEDDKASGHGILEYSNGDLYEGDWENDQRNGNEKHLCGGGINLYLKKPEKSKNLVKMA